MTEISQAPPASASDIPKSEPDFDPETMRKTKPGLKRVILTLTVLISFVLGLPFLLKSVEIYRSPLPFREIDDLSAAVESNPLHFPCKFQAVFLNFDGTSFTADDLWISIESYMRKLSGKDSSSCGACSFNSSVSVALESDSSCFLSDSNLNWKCGVLNEVNKYEDSREYDDDLFDDYLHSLLDNGSPRIEESVYTVIVSSRSEKANVRAVVGKYRHAWIVGRISPKEAMKKVAEIFVKVFVNGGKEKGSISGEFMPVGADGSIVLSFNLLNANPQDWSYDWEFKEMDELLAPITEVLKPLADIRVESQVLYHTPKSAFSYWDDNLGSYIFTMKDLPFFVNSNEWHLDTSTAAGGRSKILQFVVYVPSAAECPLQLQLPNGEVSATNGFISPMWGSVVVWNPSGSSFLSTPTFQGLRPLNKATDSPRPFCCRPVSVVSATKKKRNMAVKAELNPSLVISLSTGVSLFLGRFVFFNFQRENVGKQVPAQNGISHFEAGDERAKEYVSLLKSNDPVGFNIVDVLAWGSIGHIVAYYILATTSNGYDPSFF